MNMMMLRGKFAVFLLLAGSVGIGCAFAQPRNLDEGYPVQMEDAEPMMYGILQGQGFFRFSQFNDGTNEFRVAPGVQIGFAQRWQASLLLPVIWGTVLQPTGTDLSASALYNFQSERESLPALALRGTLDIPMYNTPQSADIRLKFIATRTLVDVTNTRLHLNAELGFLSSPLSTERQYRATGSFGMSRALGTDMTLAVDLSHEEERLAVVTSNLVEAGIRKAIGRVSSVSFSVGIGLGGQSLAYRALAGVQVWICDIVCPPGALP